MNPDRTTIRRRTLIALGAAGALVPAAAHAQWPFSPRRRPPVVEPAPVTGRAAYAGPQLRQQFGDWQFDRIRLAVSNRLQPVIRDGLEARFMTEVEAMPGVSAASVAVAEPGGAVWTHGWTREPGAVPVRFDVSGLRPAYAHTLAMQMVEAGDLSLEAALDRWAPDAPNAADITLEDLMAHTSGLTAGEPAPALQAARQPGAAFVYDPVNEQLLETILAAVAGGSVTDLMKTRIAERRELTETAFEADGTIMASTFDLVRFWRDVLGDRLHGAQATRRRFYRLYPVSGGGPAAGLGVLVDDLPAPAEDAWLGYRPPADPAQAPALVAYSMARRAVIAVALQGQGSAFGLARALMDEVPAA